jgi:hypothetical protein
MKSESSEVNSDFEEFKYIKLDEKDIQIISNDNNMKKRKKR